MRGGHNPSSLEVVEESCGGTDCHSAEAGSESDHIQRVMTSIQATYAGAIYQCSLYLWSPAGLGSPKRNLCGQDTDGESKTGIMALEAFLPEQDNNPAVLSFAENCLYCHISGEPLPGAEFERIDRLC